MELGRYSITADVEVVKNLPDDSVIVKVGEFRVLLQPWLFEFTPALPEEPADYAVVLDRDGDAWQSDMGEWSMAGADSGGDNFEVSWASLNERYGPVKVIHVPASE